MADFTIHNERVDDIELNIEKMKDAYSVKDKYKRRQKTNNGKLIPFEAIGKTLYKDGANSRGKIVLVILRLKIAYISGY